MMATRRVRPRIGDLVRITDHAGRAADAQYTHEHPMYGCLLRVLGPAATAGGASDPVRIAARPPQFLTFFPLRDACAHGIATILGSAAIPSGARAFPLFRAGTRRLDGERGYHEEGWWLWDGEREWRIGRLTADIRRLPLRQIVNDTLLVDLAYDGWRVENEG